MRNTFRNQRSDKRSNIRQIAVHHPMHRFLFVSPPLFVRAIAPSVQGHTPPPFSNGHTIVPSAQSHTARPFSNVRAIEPSVQGHTPPPFSNVRAIEPSAQGHTPPPFSNVRAIEPSAQSHTARRSQTSVRSSHPRKAIRPIFLIDSPIISPMQKAPSPSFPRRRPRTAAPFPKAIDHTKTARQSAGGQRCFTWRG